MTRRVGQRHFPLARHLAWCIAAALAVVICKAGAAELGTTTLAAAVAEQQQPGAASNAADTSITDSTSTLEVELGVGLWMPRLIGDTKINSVPGSSKISLDNQLDLHDIEPTFNFDATFAVPDVAFRISGFKFSTDGGDTFTPDPSIGASQQLGDLTLNAGDTFDSHFELWSVGVEARLQALNFARGIGGNDSPASISIVPVIAARWIDVEQSVSVGAIEQANHSQWICAQIGGAFALRWDLPHDLPVCRQLNIKVAGLLGPVLGGDPGFVWELRAGLGLAVTDNFSASFGYRLLNFDVEDEDFELDAGLQGLFVAGSVRF